MKCVGSAGYKGGEREGRDAKTAAASTLMKFYCFLERGQVVEFCVLPLLSFPPAKMPPRARTQNPSVFELKSFFFGFFFL